MNVCSGPAARALFAVSFESGRETRSLRAANLMSDFDRATRSEPRLSRERSHGQAMDSLVSLRNERPARWLRYAGQARARGQRRLLSEQENSARDSNGTPARPCHFIIIIKRSGARNCNSNWPRAWPIGIRLARRAATSDIAITYTRIQILQFRLLIVVRIPIPIAIPIARAAASWSQRRFMYMSR